MNKLKFNGKEIILLVCIILGFMCVVTSGTYAYLSYSSGINNSITGNMGKVDLELNVTRVLPTASSVDSILIFRFNELAGNLNKGCIDKDGDYSLCQLYKVNLKNNSNAVNVNVKGSLSFSNADMPNLSWVLLGNTYSSSTTYTSAMLGDSFNTATSEYKSFVDDYLLSSGDEINFYILLWVNEIDRVQYDRGTYSGIVRFEDHRGNGVSAEFGDTPIATNPYIVG